MTSVPKPFKFLKEFYEPLRDYYNKLFASAFKQKLADFLSVLAMVFDEQGKTLELLFQGTRTGLLGWGFEYLNYLSGEIARDFEKRQEKEEPVDHLIGLVREMVPYFMENNSEVTAIDLLLEVDQLEQIFPFVNGQNAERIVEYLNNCAFYGVDSLEMQKTFKISYQICLSQK